MTPHVIMPLQETSDDSEPTDDAKWVSGHQKVRNALFGSKLAMDKLRVSNIVEIIWYMRVIKQGRCFELTPTRPGCCLRSTLQLGKGELAQLL
jgi:hypothetical protein